MKIVYMPNPMKTIVELDESEKEKLRLLIKIEELEERIVSAHVTLNPNYRQFMSKRLGREATSDDVIEATRDRLDYDYILGDKKYGDETFEQHINYLCNEYLKSLQEEHEGDCICFPASCPKCYAERLLGIDTIRGLGKHEGSKISWMFRPEQKGGPDKSIDEVIEQLRNYKPINTNPNWPDDDFNLHIPRWTHEAKNALEWLVDYKSKKL